MADANNLQLEPGQRAWGMTFLGLSHYWIRVGNDCISACGLLSALAALRPEPDTTIGADRCSQCARRGKEFNHEKVTL